MLLPLLVLAATALIGSRGRLLSTSFSTPPEQHWAALPGMGATILPRWTLGNHDPRSGGTGRGGEWPVPGGTSYVPDSSTTLTRFPLLVAGESLIQLELVKRNGRGGE